jgi:uncharacterized protein YdeI (YjbR/CyaY-like superfamily)
MPPSARKSFTALLEPDGTRLRWVIARVPFDIARCWPVRRGRRVRGEIEGFAFRTSLFPDPRGSGHILLVNKKMQAGAHAQAGSRVRIVLEPDLEERKVVIPPEFGRILRANPRLSRWFDRLSPSMRRYIGEWTGEPKNAATRLKRADKMAERLVLTMEGEEQPPPVLRAAFERQPLARQGWFALTAAQRRGHLLGIFYYQKPDARTRRAAQAVEDALRAAHKRSGDGV